MLISRAFFCFRSIVQATRTNVGCVHCLQKFRKPISRYRKYRNIHLAARYCDQTYAKKFRRFWLVLGEKNLTPTNLQCPLKLEYAQIDAAEGKEHLSPLFIHHGLFGSKQNWRSLSKAFSSRTGRKVIVIDARNHGESEHHDEMNYHIMANDTLQLIKELDLEKVIVIGHSMGGKVAMTLALSHPDVVDKLIVEDAAPGDSISDKDLQRYLAAKMKLDLSGLKNRSDADKQLLEAAPNPMIRQFFLTNLVKTDVGFKWRVNLEAIESSLACLMSFPTQFPTEQYSGKTLFIGGGRSEYIQDHHYPTIYKLFPKAEIKYIADSGHWIHSEKPMDFLNMVLEFISEEQHL